MITNFIIGSLVTDIGIIPKVSDVLTFSDVVGTIKVRWSINRNNYKVSPGLYAHGNPDKNSNVFVTANYKLSFDHLRKNLNGINCWILVLDTKGINVWCAAGKGTFGTDELIKKINDSQLEKVIDHKKVICPQLGAVGISAHEVRKKTGFHVIYGPVKADDIPAFINMQLKTDSKMRTINFNFYDRTKLTPVEIVGHSKYLLFTLALFFILGGINAHGYSLDLAFTEGFAACIKICTGYLLGTLIVPMILPYIPSRSFALKGSIPGIIAALLFVLYLPDLSMFARISWLFIIPAISSFTAMNFTGTSTFTSLSGVMKEMKIAVPMQIIFAGIGLILWIIGRFI